MTDGKDVTDIPVKMKLKLLEFARRLPESRRARFLTETSKKVAAFAVELVSDNRNSITYGVIGFALGRILDEFLVLTIPVVGPFRLTQNLAGVVLGAVGVGHGFLKDADYRRLRRIVYRELRRAQDDDDEPPFTAIIGSSFSIFSINSTATTLWSIVSSRVASNWFAIR